MVSGEFTSRGTVSEPITVSPCWQLFQVLCSVWIRSLIYAYGPTARQIGSLLIVTFDRRGREDWRPLPRSQRTRNCWACSLGLRTDSPEGSPVMTITVRPVANSGNDRGAFRSIQNHQIYCQFIDNAVQQPHFTISCEKRSYSVEIQKIH